MQFLELCSFNLPQFFNKFYNDPCLKALKDAGLKKEDISALVLVDAMTRVPKVILSASVPVLVLDKQRNVRRLVLMAIIGVVILVCYLALKILSKKKETAIKQAICDNEKKETAIKQAICDNDKCIICIESYEENKRDRLCLLKCSHIFHERCLTEWVKLKSQCPLCRSPVSVTFTHLLN